jgi:exodeoxyribonuclease-3
VRIATWNVNSLKARLPRVEEWLAQRTPDILLMQETKLADEAAPVLPFQMAGYTLAHHGEGRWNGVAVAARAPVGEVTFGFEGHGRDADGARFIAARVGDTLAISIYAPNGRSLDSPRYAAKLDWYARLLSWLRANADPGERIVLGGDLNVAPVDIDVYDPAEYIGTTHTSAPERAAFDALIEWGFVDAYRRFHPEPGKFTWWDYRAGNFHKGLGMRIDHLLVTRPMAERLSGAEIDRDARKGKLPSDHAPLWIDLEDA